MVLTFPPGDAVYRPGDGYEGKPYTVTYAEIHRDSGTHGWHAEYDREHDRFYVWRDTGNAGDQSRGYFLYRVPAAMDTAAMEWVDRASKKGIELTPGDFVIIDGEPTIDGMSPSEWLDAMTMD